MATLAAAFASSHSLMLACELDDWLTRFRQSDLRMPYYDEQGEKISYADVLARAPAAAEERITAEAITARYLDVQAAMTRMKSEIASAKLDALIIVGDDQHELFLDQHMPSMAIYYGETLRNAQRKEVPADDWYQRGQMRRLEAAGDMHYACHAPLARHLIEGLVAKEFDVSAIASLGAHQYEGHAYSFIHRWYLNGSPGSPGVRDHDGPASLPVVPVFLNTYNPPNQPTPRRCVKLGTALREIIATFPGDERIGVLASGGLSHFIVEEDMDRAIIEALRNKDMNFLASLDPRRLKAGSSEIRNWIVVAAAANALDLTWASYTPAYRSAALTGTGLGFARWS